MSIRSKFIAARAAIFGVLAGLGIATSSTPSQANDLPPTITSPLSQPQIRDSHTRNLNLFYDIIAREGAEFIIESMFPKGAVYNPVDGKVYEIRDVSEVARTNAEKNNLIHFSYMSGLASEENVRNQIELRHLSKEDSDRVLAAYTQYLKDRVPVVTVSRGMGQSGKIDPARMPQSRP